MNNPKFKVDEPVNLKIKNNNKRTNFDKNRLSFDKPAGHSSTSNINTNTSLETKTPKVPEWTNELQFFKI